MLLVKFWELRSNGTETRILVPISKSYLKKVLDRFGMSGAKLVTLPISQQFKLSNDQAPSSEGDKEFMAKIPYANAVGSLMYVIVCT